MNDPSGRVLPPLVGFAAVCLIVYGLAHLPSGFSSVALLVQPVVAALLAWILLSEALGALEALGGAVVLAGIVTARLGSRRPAKT